MEEYILKGGQAMLKIFKNFKKEESGQALIMVALLLGVLGGFTALVVDVGYMYVQKSQLQSAADAAALAGAITLGKTTTGANTAVNATVGTYLDDNLDGAFIYTQADDLVVDGTNRTVKVSVGQVTPKFFAGILSAGTTTIKADATAKYTERWDGEALPFVNLDDDYTKANLQIQLWEKLGNGDFESLWKDDYKAVNSGESNAFFDVEYADGLSVTKGVVAEGPEKIKSNMQIIMDRKQDVYILSLSKAVIDSKKYADIGNKLVIDFKDLVLIKVEIVSFDPNGNNPALVLKVKNVYNIGSGEYPVDYNLLNGLVKSTLIE